MMCGLAHAGDTSRARWRWRATLRRRRTRNSANLALLVARACLPDIADSWRTLCVALALLPLDAGYARSHRTWRHTRSWTRSVRRAWRRLTTGASCGDPVSAHAAGVTCSLVARRRCSRLTCLCVRRRAVPRSPIWKQLRAAWNEGVLTVHLQHAPGCRWHCSTWRGRSCFTERPLRTGIRRGWRQPAPAPSQPAPRAA
jgi:hypothetical protein